MMTNLSWSALILAALAAVAWWSVEDGPACEVSRPVFGATACCQGHRIAGRDAARLEAAWRPHIATPAQP
jgi:hypothetical protein